MDCFAGTSILSIRPKSEFKVKGSVFSFAMQMNGKSKMSRMSGQGEKYGLRFK
tara:strand:- start:370 stop:528 length:159 start_codon:yes stop_codon:yes gene_type:complete